MISFLFANSTHQTQRVIGDVRGNKPGPTVVFVGGVHGNEPSSVVALQRVFAELAIASGDFQGRALALVGNLAALAQQRRYISQDLNRMWNADFSRNLAASDIFADSSFDDAVKESISERTEQRELFEIIEPLLQELGSAPQSAGTDQSTPLYFLDLHTTSAPSVPFIAINDQLNNRNFALQFPVPTVLGIEEYLSGPMLSYLNDYGPVALAFEAGQHDDPMSIEVHVAFTYLALLAAGFLRIEQIPDLKKHQLLLENCGRNHQGIYEVIYRQPVAKDDAFVMNPGYRNFTPIDKGAPLATDRTGAIIAPQAGNIFMPLYQNSGDDGFFVVRRVPRWALRLSTVLRKINFERVLVWLPGVSRSSLQSDALVVNKKVARFLAKELFHLLGYRRKKDVGSTMLFSRREIT